MESDAALSALKYMLLCKIMLAHTDEVANISSGKLAVKYASSTALAAMKDFASSYKNKSLAEFDKALNVHREHLLQDPIINSHLTDLYETLLEQNILRVIEPYSVVEIDHLVRAVGLEKSLIEKK